MYPYWGTRLRFMHFYWDTRSILMYPHWGTRLRFMYPYYGTRLRFMYHYWGIHLRFMYPDWGTRLRVDNHLILAACLAVGMSTEKIDFVEDCNFPLACTAYSTTGSRKTR